MTFVILDNNELFVSKMKIKNLVSYLEWFQIAKCVLKMKYPIGLVIQTSLDLHDFF